MLAERSQRFPSMAASQQQQHAAHTYDGGTAGVGGSKLAVAAPTSSFSLDNSSTARMRDAALTLFDDWAVRIRQSLGNQRNEFEVAMRNEHENLEIQIGRLEETALIKVGKDADKSARMTTLSVKENELLQSQSRHRALLDQQVKLRSELDTLRTQISERQQTIQQKQVRRQHLLSAVQHELRLYETLCATRVVPISNGATFVFAKINPRKPDQSFTVSAVLKDLDRDALRVGDIDMAVRLLKSDDTITTPLKMRSAKVAVGQTIQVVQHNIVSALNVQLMQTEDLYQAIIGARQAFCHLAHNNQS